MDADTALVILHRVAPQFLSVVSTEAATLPEGEGELGEGGSEGEGELGEGGSGG